MSVSLLTQKICNHALPQAKRYDMRDTLVCGLFLRVEVSGRKTWYVNYRTPAPEKRSKNLKLGPFEMPLSQARQAARVFIAKLYLEREDPAISLGYSKYSGMTLAKLINEYEPWVNTHMKSGKTTIRLLRLFKEFMDKPIKSITAKEISKWQIEKTGTIRGATINRRVAALQSLLGWAVKQQYLPETQFRVSKAPQNDSKTVIRYLSPEERARLMSALEEREEKNGRDYLKPAVVLSLNTGIRKGTLMGLMWEDINFASQTMLLRAAIMKGGRTCVLPLNATAMASLKEWQSYTGRESGYIFPGDGTKLLNIKRTFSTLIKKSKIENFTWHCMRHDFASQLAMKGVPIHSIQKLMCHASIEMTQRYAHLSQNSLENAVTLLEE